MADRDSAAGTLAGFPSFRKPEMTAMFGVDRLDDRVDLDEDPPEVLDPEHMPGPKSDSSTGSRIIPWSSPSRMTWGRFY
jgi:hypothetical protein